jgi:hypothetical protein
MGNLMTWVLTSNLRGPAGLNSTDAAGDDAAIAAFAGTSGTATRNKLLDDFNPKYGTRGVTRTIYVRTSGNDANDGKTTGTAFREIRAAVASLANDGPIIRGSVVIDVGAGTYKGGITFPQVRGYAQDDFVKIIGPAVGAHPAVPTAIIDYAADNTVTFGLRAYDGANVWLEAIKFLGGFDIAVDIRRDCYVQWRNAHIDGSGFARVGLNIIHKSLYSVTGGIIENCTEAGISELFGVQRSFDTVSSNAAQMIIRNCDTGLQGKEGCVGHLDYLNIESCGTGLELNGSCVANVKVMSLKKNTLGMAIVNAEIHNTGGIVWGTGLDANTRDIVVMGSAGTELDAIGWSAGTFPRTSRVGHRPLITRASSLTDQTLLGPLAETNFYSFSAAVPGRRLRVAGQKMRVEFRGSVVTTLAANYRILLRFGSSFMTDLTIPSGTVAGTRFTGEFEVVCSADGDNQKVYASLRGVTVQNYAVRTFTFTSDQTVTISAIALNAADSVTLTMCEVLA